MSTLYPWCSRVISAALISVALTVVVLINIGKYSAGSGSHGGLSTLDLGDLPIIVVAEVRWHGGWVVGTV